MPAHLGLCLLAAAEATIDTAGKDGRDPSDHFRVTAVLVLQP